LAKIEAWIMAVPSHRGRVRATSLESGGPAPRHPADARTTRSLEDYLGLGRLHSGAPVVPPPPPPPQTRTMVRPAVGAVAAAAPVRADMGTTKFLPSMHLARVMPDDESAGVGAALSSHGVTSAAVATTYAATFLRIFSPLPIEWFGHPGM
jgi:hypothetical protein